MHNFNNLPSFIAHFAARTIATQVGIERSLEQAAKKIEKRAKAKIGTYQDTDGAHGAWPELAESTKADRVRKGFTENDPGLRSGKMRKSISHQTHGLEAVIGSNDQNLVYFEMGTKKQPPRSVLGAAAFEAMPEVLKIVGHATVTGIVGGDSKSETY